MASASYFHAMKHLFLFTFLLSLLSHASGAQSRYPGDSTLYKGYGYRLIGPFRGGRASGVCGDYKNKQVFYMGATGGGVWKTRDGGSNWSNISDKYFGGSIGAVEVCPTDPLLIYVGTGENTLRGNVSEGHGMWKSTDGGKTWTLCGLSDTRHITRIVFHPRNPEIVYCAATGHLFGPNEERGIFQTTDGGKSWKKILFVNDEAGAIDLVMDPVNPEILYASTWRVRRRPHSFESGGEGSGIWKSTDGGDTWTNISRRKGLPKDTLGNIGLAIAPSNSDRLYAMIESLNGGLFTSADAGETWTRVNDDSRIRQRGWYFNKVFVDPKNEQLVYICNVEFWKSADGGKTLQQIHTPHGDHHNLWIDPEDGQRMIIADDGGSQISFDGGQRWSTYHNQPTAQFYRVTTDNHFPYRILGCQQDNSSVRILSRSMGSSIGQQDWSSSAGFESGHIVADPLNDDIVYGGNYGGYLSRLNHRTGETRTVSVYPVSPIGDGADTLKYRFQWNFPVFFSPHNPRRLYAAGNHLFVSEDEGQHWEKISPDLTTNDKDRQKPSGGPITKDNTGVEYYCTIFAAAESPAQKDLLWCGSDDGLLHVSRDGGKQWENVTPAGMPEWMMFNCIEPDPKEAGTCYVVGTRYKLDDHEPYLYKTTDYGKTWKRIVKGIPGNEFVRCARVDPADTRWLYAGTEKGMWVSMDEGNTWKPLQLNLPVVPITDLALKNDDLVVATQGRSFWVLDDLSFLRQVNEKEERETSSPRFFQPRPSYRTRGGQTERTLNEGMNPPNGVVFAYHMPEGADSLTLRLDIFLNEKKIRSFSTKGKDKQEQLPVESGMNRFMWDMQVKGTDPIEGMILWNGNIGSFKVPPGNYRAIWHWGKDSAKQDFRILKDPNYPATDQDYSEQFALLCDIRDRFAEVQQCIRDIRFTRAQINALSERLGKNYPSELDSLGKSMMKTMSEIEDRLYQTKAKSSQDVLNYPIRLNDKIAGVFDAVNQHTAPTGASREAFRDLSLLAEAELRTFRDLQQKELKHYNALIREKQIDYILPVQNKEEEK